MKQIICIIICILFLLTGCTGFVSMSDYENMSNSYQNQLNRYQACNNELSTAKAKVVYVDREDCPTCPTCPICPTCPACPEQLSIGQTCSSYIATIKRLEEERDGILDLNDTAFCENMTESYEQCSQDLVGCNETLEDLRDLLE